VVNKLLKQAFAIATNQALYNELLVVGFSKSSSFLCWCLQLCLMLSERQLKGAFLAGFPPSRE
jgi:hypothetical protein